MKNFDYLKNIIANVKDFPVAGIMFRDITPLFEQPKEINKIIDAFAAIIKDWKIDVIVAPESRGFLFGVPLALKCDIPFVMVRKPNKLPRETFEISYKLEYGESKFQMHTDSIKVNQRVLIIDDLLATGGTTKAIEQLIKRFNAQTVGSLYLVELADLNGREGLTGEVISLIQY